MIYREGKWHTIIFNFENVLRYCTALQCLVWFIWSQWITPQNCLRLQCRTGSLFSCPRSGCRKQSQPWPPGIQILSAFIVLKGCYPPQKGTVVWRSKYIFSKGCFLVCLRFSLLKLRIKWHTSTQQPLRSNKE